MKLPSLFKWGMALLALMLVLWVIPPAMAQDVGLGDVPIAFGTDADAVVPDADVVVEPTPPDNGFRLDVFLAILGVSGLVVFLLYRSSPPSTQATIISVLDFAKVTFQHLKDLPGTQYDDRLQQVVDEIDDLKRRLLQPPTTNGVRAEPPNF